MDGHNGYPAKGFRPALYIGTFAFKPNGASAIDSTANVGSLKGKVTVTKNATGEYYLTFASGMIFPERPVFTVEASSPDGAASEAWCGSWDSTNRILTVWTGTTRGTAANLTANANTYVAVTAHIINSTGK